MTESDWVTLGVGAFGVLIGGAITFVGEARFRAVDRRILKLERLNRYHRTAQTAFTDLLNLNNQLCSDVPDKPDGPLWHLVRAMEGVDATPIGQNLDDVSLFNLPKFEPVVGSVWEILGARNSAMGSLVTYNQLRVDLENALAPFVEFAGDETRTSLAYKKDPQIVMLEHRVESLAQALISIIRDACAKMYDRIDDYNWMVREIEGKKGKLKLSLPKR